MPTPGRPLPSEPAENMAETSHIYKVMERILSLIPATMGRYSPSLTGAAESASGDEDGPRRHKCKTPMPRRTREGLLSLGVLALRGESRGRPCAGWRGESPGRKGGGGGGAEREPEKKGGPRRSVCFLCTSQTRGSWAAKNAQKKTSIQYHTFNYT